MLSWREADEDMRAMSVHRRTVGYVRLTDELVDALVRHGPWLEIGAGSGALSKAIRLKGGRSVPTDNYTWSDQLPVGQIDKVWKCDGVRAAGFIKKLPSVGLLTSWPYMDSMAHDAAALLGIGQKLAYIGEGEGGCTANDDFFDLVDNQFEVVEEVPVHQFWGLHDRMTIFRRTSHA